MLVCDSLSWTDSFSKCYSLIVCLPVFSPASTPLSLLLISLSPHPPPTDLQAKASGKKLQKVTLKVSPRGIILYDSASTQLIENISIYRSVSLSLYLYITLAIFVNLLDDCNWSETHWVSLRLLSLWWVARLPRSVIILPSWKKKKKKRFTHTRQKGVEGCGPLPYEPTSREGLCGCVPFVQA